MTQLLIVICLEAIYFEECVFRRAYMFQDANQSLEYFEHPFPVLED